jgi:hypothetical protein
MAEIIIRGQKKTPAELSQEIRTARKKDNPAKTHKKKTEKEYGLS